MSGKPSPPLSLLFPLYLDSEYKQVWAYAIFQTSGLQLVQIFNPQLVRWTKERSQVVARDEANVLRGRAPR